MYDVLQILAYFWSDTTTSVIITQFSHSGMGSHTHPLEFKRGKGTS